MRVLLVGVDPGQDLPGYEQNPQTPPAQTVPKRMAITQADFNMLNTIGYWLSQTGVEKQSEDGEIIYKSVLEDKTRQKANDLFCEIMDRFSNEVKLREGKDATV